MICSVERTKHDIYTPGFDLKFDVNVDALDKKRVGHYLQPTKCPPFQTIALDLKSWHFHSELFGIRNLFYQ